MQHKLKTFKTIKGAVKRGGVFKNLAREKKRNLFLISFDKKENITMFNNVGNKKENQNQFDRSVCRRSVPPASIPRCPRADRSFLRHSQAAALVEIMEKHDENISNNRPVAPGQKKLGSARDAMAAHQERAAGTAGAGVSPQVHHGNFLYDGERLSGRGANTSISGGGTPSV